MEDPLNEDDFEVDVKKDAAEYSELQRSIAHRDAIKEDNKRRRAQGLATVKLPTQRRHRAGPHTSGRQSVEMSLLSEADRDGGEPEDEMVAQSKRPRLSSSDALEYEGPATRSEIDATERIREAVIVQAPGLQASDTVSAASGSGTLGLSPLNSSRADNVESDLESEMSQADHYIDEAVILPTINWQEDDDDIQGTYSEDEIFASSLDSHRETPERATPSTSRPAEAIVDGGLQPTRPAFGPLGSVTASPLILDPHQRDVMIPAPLNHYLKEYQKEGVRFLYRKYAAGTGAVLGDDMGLGKTVQVIAFLSAIMRKSGTLHDYQRRKMLIRRLGKDIRPKHWPTALIICPKFLLRNWQRELQTWGYFETEIWQPESWINTRAAFQRGYLDIILASYETVRGAIEQLKDMPFSVVIADEAHRLKEPGAAITLAIKKIQVTSCFALSGTIIQNRLDEMWSILDFVDRGYAGTQKEWRNFVVNPIKMGHRHEGTVEEVVTAVNRLGVMYAKVLPYFYLRRDKRLIAHELPAKRDLVAFCPLAVKQVQAYQAFIASEDVQFILTRHEPCECGSNSPRIKCCHARSSEGETVPEVLLKSINALSKVANHLGLLYHAKDDNENTVRALLKLASNGQRNINRRIFRICTGEDYDTKQHNVVAAALDTANCGKWELLSSLLQDWRRDKDENNKVLIFSNSVRLLKMIAEFISTSLSVFPFDILTGELDIDSRMRMIDRFQDTSQDLFILLISTMAGGVGLNLTAANKVVIFDPAWNPANDLQAMDRAFRIGQKRTVDVYRLIGQGTLEELMYERQIQKQQRSRQLNEGTFESRMHQGVDRGRDKEEQGELFGAHNIFKFDAKGFVPGRIDRVLAAEDRFVQDLIDAEYDGDERQEDGGEDEAARMMRQERRDRDKAKAQTAAKSRRNDKAIMQTVLGEDPEIRRLDKTSDPEFVAPRNDDDVLRALGISSHVHDTAFRDSPEERAIFELGLTLLKTNPALAAKLKANDVGKLGRPRKEVEADGVISFDLKEAVAEPWQERAVRRRTQNRNTILAELSD